MHYPLSISYIDLTEARGSDNKINRNDRDSRSTATTSAAHTSTATRSILPAYRRDWFLAAPDAIVQLRRAR